MDQPLQLLFSSKSNEWYTPPWIIEATRHTLGSIDLDPASCEIANCLVRAGQYYTQKQDGLHLPWFGNVWLNPPYGKTNGKSNQEIWAARMLLSYATGTITAGVMLTRTAPGYAWWEELFDGLSVCLLRERICFWRESQSGELVQGGQAKHGTSIWYVGDRADRFVEAFSPHGRVILPETGKGFSRLLLPTEEPDREAQE